MLHQCHFFETRCIAYLIAAVALNLGVRQGHSSIVSIFKWDVSQLHDFYTDGCVAWFLCHSRAACNLYCLAKFSSSENHYQVENGEFMLIECQ